MAVVTQKNILIQAKNLSSFRLSNAVETQLELRQFLESSQIM